LGMTDMENTTIVETRVSNKTVYSSSDEASLFGR